MEKLKELKKRLLIIILYLRIPEIIEFIVKLIRKIYIIILNFSIGKYHEAKYELTHWNSYKEIPGSFILTENSFNKIEDDEDHKIFTDEEIN